MESLMQLRRRVENCPYFFTQIVDRQLSTDQGLELDP